MAQRPESWNSKHLDQAQAVQSSTFRASCKTRRERVVSKTRLTRTGDLPLR